MEKRLRDLDYPTIKLLNTRIRTDDVTQLAEDAHEALRKIPSKGGEPTKARRQLIEDLADIFQKFTGKRPTRSVRKGESRASGPFPKFVEAVLSPVNTRAMDGVDADIRAVIKRRAAKIPNS